MGPPLVLRPAYPVVRTSDMPFVSTCQDEKQADTVPGRIVHDGYPYDTSTCVLAHIHTYIYA